MSRSTIAAVALITLIVSGCAADRGTVLQPLRAPEGTASAVKQEMQRGNELFTAQDWNGAKLAYTTAVGMDASLAEAHYNLALTLDRLGNKAEAKKHYVEAANLAPGNKVIWDAPPLRKFDRDREFNKKSFLDANPR